MPPLGLVLVLALACLPGLACADHRRENLVLISIDTLRADHLGCYGYERATSPAIDALAAEGVLFERAYSQSPKTAPSHMTILTGLLPETHGVRNWAEGGNEPLSRDVPTLASILKGEGYSTLALTDYGHVHPRLGFDRGFDGFGRGGGNQAFVLGRRFLQEWTSRPRAEPFFLFLHTYAVHDPYTPPAAVADRFTDPGYGGRIVSSPEVLAGEAGDGWQPRHDLFWSLVDPRSAADRQHLQDLYDAAIFATDRHVGRFLRALEESQLVDETWVVLLSDHGEEFGEHGGFLHNSVYQEVLHVPLVVRFPRSSAAGRSGVRVPQVVRLVDVLPTLLDALGIAAPEHLQGASLLPLAEGRDDRVSRRVLSQWPLLGLDALRVGPLKYIAGGEEPELYDLEADPAERRNLARERPGDARRLLRELEASLEASRALRTGFTREAPVTLGDETRERLEALGYLEAQ